MSLASLRQAVLARDEAQGYRRHVVEEIAEYRRPELLRPYTQAWVSSRSCTIRDARLKKVIRGDEVSSGQIARAYLRCQMERAAEETGRASLARRVPRQAGATEMHASWTPAYFFSGEAAGPFALVDITACYWTLALRLGCIDLTWVPTASPPLLGIGVIRVEPDDVGSDKLVRNAIIGSTVRPHVTWWRHGTPVEDRMPNRFHAPDFFAAVLGATHAIASEAVRRFGALSWSVDGGAFRPEEGRAFIAWLARAWGLEATVRTEGPGWLWGPNCWTIGGLSTADVAKGRALHVGPYSSLRRLRPQATARLRAAIRDHEGGTR